MIRLPDLTGYTLSVRLRRGFLDRPVGKGKSTDKIEGDGANESDIGSDESAGFLEVDGGRSGGAFDAVSGFLGELGPNQAECALYGD